MGGAQVLNVSQAARIAGVSRQAVLKALHTGKLVGLGTSPPTLTRDALANWQAQRRGPHSMRHAEVSAGEQPQRGPGQLCEPAVVQAEALRSQADTIAMLAEQLHEAIGDAQALRAENAALRAEVATLRHGTDAVGA